MCDSCGCSQPADAVTFRRPGEVEHDHHDHEHPHTHDHHVRSEVWELYRYVHQQTGGVSTLLEWDDNFVSFEETLAEANLARNYQNADPINAS